MRNSMKRPNLGIMDLKKEKRLKPKGYKTYSIK
jgi:hypothetical protein